MMSIQRLFVAYAIAVVVVAQSTIPQYADAASVVLASYIPVTDVTYQSTIDTDQQQIQQLLIQITGNDQQQDQRYLDEAYAIYLQRLRALNGMDGTIFRKPSNTDEFLDLFSLYVNYMGDSDFAHDFIVSGFNDTATTSGYCGPFQLVEYSLPGGLQNVIQLGTVLLTLTQYIIRNLDIAVEECIICSNTATNNNITGNNTLDCGTSLIDEAAAYYVGSLQSTLSNSYEGYLLYSTADRLCQLFNTCDGSYTTADDVTIATSRVNMMILQQLTNMQGSIQSRSCNDAMNLRNSIVSQLFVPMIQGTIRSVYYTEQSMVSDFCSADATMYAASILPLIYNCSEGDAKILLDHTDPDRTIPTNATLVNELLSRNYACLGITTDDIGMFNPDTLVEWGTCGQPTPAPVIAKPITSSPPSSPIPTTSTASPINNSAAPMTAPTFLQPTMQQQPAPIAVPTTTSSSSSRWNTRSCCYGLLLIISTGSSGMIVSFLSL